MCNINTTNFDTVYEDGCVEAVTELIGEQLLIVAAIAIAFVIGEVNYITFWCGK